MSDVEYDPGKFKSKSRLGDYIVYGLLLALVLGVGGSTVYYQTRQPDEQKALRKQANRILAAIPFLGFRDNDAPHVVERKAPRMEAGILPEETSLTPATPPPPAPPPPSAPIARTSVYAGGGQSGVRPSGNPQAPAPGEEFTLFANSLKVSSVVQGSPAKVMLNGRIYNIGDTLNAELGVVLVRLDATEKHLLLRDRTRAELLLFY